MSTVTEQQKSAEMMDEVRTVTEGESEIDKKLRGKAKSGRGWKGPITRFVFQIDSELKDEVTKQSMPNPSL